MVLGSDRIHAQMELIRYWRWANPSLPILVVLGKSGLPDNLPIEVMCGWYFPRRSMLEGFNQVKVVTTFEGY